MAHDGPIQRALRPKSRANPLYTCQEVGLAKSFGQSDRFSADLGIQPCHTNWAGRRRTVSLVAIHRGNPLCFIRKFKLIAAAMDQQRMS